jgi:hypothetical protein
MAEAASQPNKGKRKSTQQDDEDYEDEGAGSSQVFSQASARDRAWSSMSLEDQKMSVNTVMNYMLARDSDKLPAKRSDISDLFKRTSVGSHAKPPIDRIIAEAQKKFRHVFGFDLREETTDNISDDVGMSSQAQSKQVAQKVYLLTNVLKMPAEEGGQEVPAEEKEFKVSSDRAQMLSLGAPSNPSPHFELAMAVMAVIALKRYSITEQELWDMMRSVGLTRNQAHPVFGQPETAIKELCQQGYLYSKKTKDADGQPQVRSMLCQLVRLLLSHFALVDARAVPTGDSMCEKCAA